MMEESYVSNGLEDHKSKKAYAVEHESELGILATDPDICQPHLKSGVCSGYPNCPKHHLRLKNSPTILIKNLFRHTELDEKPVELPSVLKAMFQGTSGKVESSTEKKLLREYKKFYNDIIIKFHAAGPITMFKCSRNCVSHLKGNVYVQYSSHEYAARAALMYDGFYYNKREMEVELCPVVNWKASLCSHYEKDQVCPEEASCSMLHAFCNPKDEYRNDYGLGCQFYPLLFKRISKKRKKAPDSLNGLDVEDEKPKIKSLNLEKESKKTATVEYPKTVEYPTPKIEYPKVVGYPTTVQYPTTAIEYPKTPVVEYPTKFTAEYPAINAYPEIEPDSSGKSSSQILAEYHKVGFNYDSAQSPSASKASISAYIKPLEEGGNLNVTHHTLNLLNSEPFEAKLRNPVNCRGYLKTGACGNGARCKAKHPPRLDSPTVMLPNFFQHPYLNEYSSNGLVRNSQRESELQLAYKDFYEDIIDKFRELGKIVMFKTCRNQLQYLKGNVYVHYDCHESASQAVSKFDGTMYGDRRIEAALSPVVSWLTAVCADFDEGDCKRHDCRFLHVFNNPGNEFSGRVALNQDYYEMVALSQFVQPKRKQSVSAMLSGRNVFS